MPVMIDRIFQELADMIPEMKEDPEEWKQFIREFVSHRPNAHMSLQFKEELRSQIEKKIKIEQQEAYIESEEESDVFLTMKRVLFPFLGGAALTALLLATFLPGQNSSLQRTQNTFDDQNEQMTDSKDGATSPVRIMALNDSNAFGTLKIDPNTNVARPQSGGGGDMLEIMDADMRIMPFPQERINYEYEYTGEDIAALEENTTVYQRQRGANEFSVPSNMLQQWDMNAVDLTKLLPAKAQQISLRQTEGELPYIISLDFSGNSISFMRDYEVWNKKFCGSNGLDCTTDPLLPEDAPSDAELVRIARDFLDEYGISLTQTGTPYVDKYWEYETFLADQQRVPEFVPDILGVVFPFEIDGEEVQQQWQNSAVGIRVDVNLRQRLVSNAHVPVMSLTSSEYETRTAEEILSLAEQGGREGVVYVNPERTVRLELGTPRRELLQIWNYTGTWADEVYMEMLVFPVTNLDQEGGDRFYIPREVIVPLAKDTAINTAPEVPAVERLEMSEGIE